MTNGTATMEARPPELWEIKKKLDALRTAHEQFIRELLEPPREGKPDEARRKPLQKNMDQLMQTWKAAAKKAYDTFASGPQTMQRLNDYEEKIAALESYFGKMRFKHEADFRELTSRRETFARKDRGKQVWGLLKRLVSRRRR